MAELHEDREQLSAKTLDIKRAIDSMREELEAVDWYRQRREVASDPELRAILDHHQREELEHFVMLLEWCRRNDADFAEQLREYLFTEAPILEVEESSTEGGAPRKSSGDGHASNHRVTLGSLKPKEAP
jgi:ferritin-like protein